MPPAGSGPFSGRHHTSRHGYPPMPPMLPPPMFEAVFAHAPVGAYLLAPDADATILAVNDAFLRNIGRSREDMLGRSLFDVFPADPNDHRDTGEAELRESIRRAIESGLPQTLPAQRYPIERVEPNGGRHYEERFWNAVNTPVHDEDGTLVCILHTTTEVTRQVQAEAALRASERDARRAARAAEAERQRLDAVLQAVPVGIVVSDADGGVLLCNAAHRALWGESQPDAKSIEDFSTWKGWWADGSERHGQPLAPNEWTTARVLHGETVLHDIIEIESFDEPHERKICLNSAAPVRDQAGRIVGAVTAQLDITDRVRAEQALRQADRRKDEFLAMLAHELRNPLAPIGAAADLLRLGTLDPDRVRQTSAIVARQVRHMTGLIDDLLDVSRVTRGLIRLDRTRLDASRVIADAIEQARPLIEEHRHRLRVRAPQAPAPVFGDAKRLVQVLTNLLTNAAKYTPDGGDITIEMEADADEVRIHVTDTGIGMSPELTACAFELFAQADRTSDRSQGGLGIGLALVRTLMDLHGGSVAAFSDGPGRGSRFTVRLPRADGDPAQPRPAAAVAAMPATTPLKVLVVDDNADAAQVLGMFVETLGHQALVEFDARRALETARTVRPDVCLLDIGLPDIDGNELARRLREQPETAGATLVAVTGYGQDHDRRDALAAGFDHHFVKPLDPARLAELLEQLDRS